MTVDGGTMRWDKFVSKCPMKIQKSLNLPDLITGDFDSITEDIMHKYKKQGCKVKIYTSKSLYRKKIFILSSQVFNHIFIRL